ncbi:hypothetical protein EMIT0180MI3_10632 [Priestia megaterium]
MSWIHSQKTINISKYRRGVFYEDSNHIIFEDSNYSHWNSGSHFVHISSS